MKVILLEEVQGKGGEGDVIDVPRGYANNYLLTQGKAIKATPGNLKQLEQRAKNIARREATRISSADDLKAVLEAKPFVVKAKVGDEGQLFGSVTSQMIAEAIKAQAEVEVDRKRIDVRQAIKVVGDHQVEVALYRDIKAAITVSVVDESAVPAPVAEEPEAEEPEAEEAEAVEEAATEEAAE